LRGCKGRGLRCRVRPLVTLILVLLVFPSLSQSIPCEGYMPQAGHWAKYDYGFISTQWNISEFVVANWTGLSLSKGNYTMLWHQYVNLTLTVISTPLITGAPYAYYGLSVEVHSNRVTVSNATWQTTVTLNASSPAPASTGIESGVVLYPANLGLPGFLLDDFTLVSIHPGTNVTLGDTTWSSITAVTIQVEGEEEKCYLLHNVTSTANSRIETTYLIEADSGVYLQANETSTFTYEGLAEEITYYYSLLSTNIPFLPSPSPLPLILTSIAVVTIAIIVVFLLFRRWRRTGRILPIRRRTPQPHEEDILLSQLDQEEYDTELAERERESQDSNLE